MRVGYQRFDPLVRQRMENEKEQKWKEGEASPMGGRRQQRKRSRSEEGGIGVWRREEEDNARGN
jgi:hypothetical protein